MQQGPRPKPHPSRKSDTSFRMFSLALLGCNSHAMAKPSGQALQGLQDQSNSVFPAQCKRPALCLVGSYFPTHCLLRMKANLLCSFSSFSLSLDLHDCYFSLHLILASQLKNKGKVSRDGTISPSALHSGSPHSHFWICPLGPPRRPHCRHRAFSGCISSSLR